MCLRVGPGFETRPGTEGDLLYTGMRITENRRKNSPFYNALPAGSHLYFGITYKGNVLKSKISSGERRLTKDSAGRLIQRFRRWPRWEYQEEVNKKQAPAWFLQESVAPDYGWFKKVYLTSIILFLFVLHMACSALHRGFRLQHCSQRSD